MTLVHWTAFASALIGWSDITVTHGRADRSHSSMQRNLANLDRPSERTTETLMRLDLERRYRKDPEAALSVLEKMARADPEADLVYAIAELSWVEGKRLDRRRKAAAIDRYVDAVAYSYDYLFDPDPRLAEGRRPTDPRFRLACELYNSGLERLIRAAQSDAKIEADGTIKIKAHGREHVLRVTLLPSPWKPDDIDQLLLASDFEVTGLIARTYQYGLGVPMIAVKQVEQPSQGAERFYPPEMTFPLTAFLVPTSRLREDNADVNAPRECVLQLVDPIVTRHVGPKETPMEVESDLTTPLAYMWSRTDLNRYRWNGLFRPGEALGRANLMLLRPYEPNKVPVVMVHGLISSPLAWIPMLNELLRDPKIQQNYQFFLYMYPTGVPIPVAAAHLRESLRHVEATYNPKGENPAFDRMVLLGHSMGGLLSHFMTVDSENKLWQLYSDRPYQEMLGKQDVLAKLQNFLFFKPLPFVRRVVYLATPHRGSELSRGVVGRVGANLISEVDQVSDLLTHLVKDNREAFPRRFYRLPSSIETLSPDSPILHSLLEMKTAPQVVAHSIIGSLRAQGTAQTTDGVVPYRSAHLDGVASELVVRSDHAVQKDPEAIREVLRILHEHLGGPSPAPGAAPAVAEPAPVNATARQ